jgi:hypothetical protein
MAEYFPSGTVAGTRRSASGLSLIRRSFSAHGQTWDVLKAGWASHTPFADGYQTKGVARKASRKIFILKD